MSCILCYEHNKIRLDKKAKKKVTLGQNFGTPYKNLDPKQQH
jgi:hypothetical protein